MNNNKNYSPVWVAVFALTVLYRPAEAQAPDMLYQAPALQVDTALRQRLQDSINAAIDPDDYVCNAPTYVDIWINQQVVDLLNISGFKTLFALDFLGTFFWASDWTLVFDHDDSDEYFGTSGEFTREQIKRHKDNKRFWDVPTDDVLLMGMHGVEIADDAKMLPLLELIITQNVGYIEPGIPEYVLETAQTLIEGGVVDFSPLAEHFGFPFPGEYSAPGIPSGV